MEVHKKTGSGQEFALHHRRLISYQNLVEEYLFLSLNSLSIENKSVKLLEAMKYSLLGGGKRIRAILLLEFCRICGGNAEKAMVFAGAIEMIHAYSLVHDDLPAMDNDDIRRGKPSNHIVFGEAMAILAGDALLTLAFETMLRARVEPELALRCSQIIAKHSGIFGMAGGQAMEMESPEVSGSYELEEINSLKTGALFRAAAMCGCILAGAGENRIRAADSFATAMGLAFQIQDDILDMDESVEKTDKCPDFINILGLENCKKKVIELTDRAIDSLGIYEDISFLIWLAKELTTRKS